MPLGVDGPPARDAACKWTGRPQGMPPASGRAARKGCHWKAGGQDAQDTQDTQEAAGPRAGRRFALANDQRVESASRLQITSEWRALRAGHSFLGVLGVLVVLARHQACAAGFAPPQPLARAFPSRLPSHQQSPSFGTPCDHPAAVGRDENKILDPHAELPFQVDARLDGHEHARLQHGLRLRAGRRLLVDLVAHAVPE